MSSTRDYDKRTAMPTAVTNIRATDNNGSYLLFLKEKTSAKAGVYRKVTLKIGIELYHTPDVALPLCPPCSIPRWKICKSISTVLVSYTFP